MSNTYVARSVVNSKIFKIHLNFVYQPSSQPACLPAIRPGCARCRALEISHNKGDDGRFMKMLFRRRFTHCAMAIPFINHSPSLFFCIPLAPSKVTIVCYGFCLLRRTKTWLTHDIISYSGMMYVYLLSHSCFAM